MTLTESVQPITADDDTIREALTHADLPSLMCALVHMTGDMSSLRGDIKPVMDFLGGAEAGLTEEQQSRVRAQAFDVLRAYRDNPTPTVVPDEDQAREMLRFLLGQDVADDYVEFLVAELAMNGEDPYAQPAMFDVPAATRESFRVVIVGAGMSGLLSAIRLQQAGIPFDVIEKNPQVGGTWYENTYPGCRVDSANHVYSYSFRPEDWPQHFSERKVLQAYFEECADEYQLHDHIHFNTEVESARFNADIGKWSVSTVGADGNKTFEANAVITAVGQLNRPNIPEIKGRDLFQGPSFHSARWQHDVSLRGKRVGVIGSGASAFQFVPIIAQDAAEVTIFQRTAPWVVPNPQYFQSVPAGTHWLLNHVPFYAKWFRFAMFWRAAEGLLGAVSADDDWESDEPSVSAANEMLRQMLVGNLQTELADDPELLAKCTPDYPPGAKRALIDDGAWLKALRRDNVNLVTDPISSIAEGGIATEGGDQHDFDVLIFATGFTASDFLMPMKIYGADGRELHDVWDGEPRAYKGITMPGFPNLFSCYGPNTNIVVNSSIIFFSECEVRYILGCLALLMQDGKKSLEVKPEVHDAYNERIDEGNRNMAWGRSTVSTWYKNASGRITQNWPYTLLKFWQQTRAPDASDYRLE